MWDAHRPGPARSSYEAARTSDDTHSDDQTLTDEYDYAAASGRDESKLPLITPPEGTDELDLDDPLDANAPTPTAAAWPQSADRLSRWRLRTSPPPPLDLTTQAHEGGVGLMNDEANVALVSGAAISPRWARAGKQTVSWLVWPLPSWLHRYFGVRYPEEPRRPTDYLDGLRGVASLFVFFSHYLLRAHFKYIHEGYAHGDNWNFFQLPFIRTVYAGSAMVSIFFVISGYVLSQRCVMFIRGRQQDKLHTTLTSMTFRRAIRLFLPSIVISLITMFIVLLGLIEPEWPEEWTWWVEFDNFRWHTFYDLFQLWDWEIYIENWYAPQLWTIPVEYRCSMILFVFILMVARTKTWTRLAVETVTIVYLLFASRWDVALFLAGMLLAEINIIVESRRKRRSETHAIIDDPEKDANQQSQQSQQRWYHVKKSNIPWWIMLILGVYLAGYPDSEAQHTPGYDFLTHFWADDWEYKFRFWLSVSAVMILLPISFLPTAQAFFSTPVARYLGKISYALYLVHELMNRTVRVVIWSMFWKVLEYKEGDEQKGLKFEGGWILGSILYIPLVIWAADVFWRAVDIPTVKFAKWLEGKLCDLD